MSAKQAGKRAPASVQRRSFVSQIWGDALAMGLWVFLSSVNIELGDMASEALDISPMATSLAVLCTGLALYEPVVELVGGKGASFNPSQNFAFAAAGQGSLTLHTLRSIGQAIGGSLGAFAALRLIPDTWQSKFGGYAHGVMPGASLMQGFWSEAVLSFVLNIVILWSMGTKRKVVGKLAPYIATVILIPLGAGLSGPFMNPAFAFSWFYHLKGAEMSLSEHLLVFWAGCLLGSYLAGLSWHTLTKQASKKRSKGHKSSSRQAKTQSTAEGKKLS